jgi:Ca2+/Na+ antiporter
MMIAQVPPQHRIGLLLIAASAIGFYIAARVAVNALTSSERPSPSRLALAHWIPVALVGIIAVLEGYPVIGICVALGTSVCALTLNLGLIISTSGSEVSAGQYSRAWPLLVPAALLTFLAGFSAQLNAKHLVLFSIEAVAAAVVWFDPKLRLRGERHGFDLGPMAGSTPGELSNGPAAVVEDAAEPRDRLTSRGWLMLILSIMAAAFGALLAVYGTVRMSLELPLTTPGLIAAVGLSPLLILPMIGTGTLIAERGHASAAASGLVGLALLNLCVLLPVMVGAWLVRRSIIGIEEIPAYIPFPIASWRVDTVLVLIMGTLLAPVAFGRWRLGRVEGIALIMVYAAYLATSSILSVRW